MPESDADFDARSVAERLLPDATRRLIRTADSLGDDEYAAPSALPGWTRAHVLAHLALAAEGMSGALTGIVEGSPAPMYPAEEARDADIERLAGAEPAAIRSRLLGACTDLADALAAVPPDVGDTVIERSPGSARRFTALDVPVMRLREVEIHHVDLAAGYDRSSWPREFAEILVDGMVRRGPATTPFRVHAVDLDRTWSTGDGGPLVTGTAADLGWWLSGRGAGEGLTCDNHALPEIGAW